MIRSGCGLLVLVALASACTSSTPERTAAPPVPPVTTAPASSAPPTTAPATSAPATAPPTSAPPVPSAAPSSAAPSPAGPGPCASSQLAVQTGPPDAGAGNAYFPLVFTNTGGSTCTLDGHPGVSYVTGETGEQVGAPAARTGTGGAVALAPGARANALLHAVSVPSDPCTATTVRGLRVYPPDQTAALFVPLPGTGTVCANATRIDVGPVTAGATPQPR